MKQEYEFLNGAEMDFSKYEEMSLSEKERDSMKRNLRRTGGNKIYRRPVIQAAACMAVLFVFAQTTVAQDIVRRIISVGNSVVIEGELSGGKITFDTAEELAAKLDFDLKIPQTLPEGYELVSAHGYGESEEEISGDYAVLTYGNNEKTFTIFERTDSGKTKYATDIQDVTEMDFGGSKAVYNDHTFICSWDGVTVNILGGDALTEEELLETAESMR